MPAAAAKAPKSRAKSAAKGGSDNPFQHRISRLRKSAAKAGHGVLLITDPYDVGYLTGFTNSHKGDGVLIVHPKGAVLLSDFRYEEELEPVWAFATIHIRKGPMTGAVGEVLAGLGAKQATFQGDSLTLAEHGAYAKAAKGVKLTPTTGLVTAMRVIKDDYEVAVIRKAVKIQEASLEAAMPLFEPGLDEMEVAAMIEFEMKRRGSSEPGFKTIVAARANGSLPHYRPSPKVKLAKNQPLLIDWGAVGGGYHSDMTRTFSLGKWPAKVAEIYEIVREAQEMSAAALAPGKTTKEVDAVARDHIAQAGYGPQFGHGLGHGIGLQGHEDPRLSHMVEGVVLKPGMVVTVEPGIYLPGVGGVRIEDDYLITEKGAKNLCSLPKTLEWCTLH